VADRGEPDASCSEWHGDGTAGEDDDRGDRLWRRYQLRRWARPVQGDTSLVGKRPRGARRSISAVLSARGLRRASSCSTHGILGSPSRQAGSAWSHASACQPIQSRPSRQGQGRAVVAAHERRPIPLTARRPATSRRRPPRPATQPVKLGRHRAVQSGVDAWPGCFRVVARPGDAAVCSEAAVHGVGATGRARGR
jgi:hypothetical protein